LGGCSHAARGSPLRRCCRPRRSFATLLMLRGRSTGNNVALRPQGRQQRRKRAAADTLAPMKLTVAQARRIAVRAQRLDTRRATAPLTLLRHLGAIQIDSVNVVARAHYLPFYSRLTASQADVDR